MITDIIFAIIVLARHQFDDLITECGFRDEELELKLLYYNFHRERVEEHHLARGESTKPVRDQFLSAVEVSDTGSAVIEHGILQTVKMVFDRKLIHACIASSSSID